jgi:hypothetical protein
MNMVEDCCGRRRDGGIKFQITPAHDNGIGDQYFNNRTLLLTQKRKVHHGICGKVAQQTSRQQSQIALLRCTRKVRGSIFTRQTVRL